jgi:hypothetical protein
MAEMRCISKFIAETAGKIKECIVKLKVRE